MIKWTVSRQVSVAQLMAVTGDLVAAYSAILRWAQ